jgi:hypothetical protein
MAMKTIDVIFVTFIVSIAVIVGSDNKYFITSIDVIAVIVGSYTQYFITSIVVVTVIVGSSAMTTIDVIKYWL